MKTTSLLATFCTLTCFILPSLVFYTADLQIIYNQSTSLKGSVFMVKHKQHYCPKVGDTVLFTHEKYATPILKKVSHIEGDAYQPMVGYFVASKEDINVQQTVPKDHIAVLGEHIKSYDSRYASFGFIQRKDIRGKAWLIF